MVTPRPSANRPSGSVLSIVLLLAAGLSAAGALVVAHIATTAELHSSKAVVRRNPTSAEGRLWLVRAGLDPKALAAAGFNAPQVTQLVSNTVDFLAGNIVAMEETEASIRTAKNEVERLETRITAGMARPGDTQSLATARVTLRTLQQSLDQNLTELRAAGIGQLPVGSAAEALAAIQRNRTKGTNLEFAVEDRTESQWVALRDALAAKRVDERQRREVPPSVTEIINRATSNAVSAAAGRLTPNNLTTITNAWNTAVAAFGGG